MSLLQVRSKDKQMPSMQSDDPHEGDIDGNRGQEIQEGE